MKVIKDFEIPLTGEDTIDVRIIKEDNKITGFVLNLRCKFSDVWYQVYRVDTCHEYLHEQRFWISPEPIPLPRQEMFSFENLFNFFMKQIKQNYESARKSFRFSACRKPLVFVQYRKYYEEKMVIR